MIDGFRGAARLLAATVFLGGLALVHAIGRPFARGRARERWRRHLLRTGCRGALRAVGARVEIEGAPPRGAGFLVTNHLGYVDVLLLGAVCDAVFVSRADVRRWPGIGLLARWSGTVFLERERRSQLPQTVAALQAALGTGSSVVFFPEGTSSPGLELLPFRSSLFEAPVRTGAPVRCATITYRTPPDRAGADSLVCWWGDDEFLPHLWRLVRSPWFVARVHFLDDEVVGGDRKRVAARTRELVESVFVPVRARGGRG